MDVIGKDFKVNILVEKLIEVVVLVVGDVFKVGIKVVIIVVVSLDVIFVEEVRGDSKKIII